ncbi:MAG: hypothetical protein JO016_00490 [Actinobacteria bacterium]|nr:hypothetical protein [Actinomycetota bacterium]
MLIVCVFTQTILLLGVPAGLLTGVVTLGGPIAALLAGAEGAGAGLAAAADAEADGVVAAPAGRAQVSATAPATTAREPIRTRVRCAEVTGRIAILRCGLMGAPGELCAKQASMRRMDFK